MNTNQDRFGNETDAEGCTQRVRVQRAAECSPGRKPGVRPSTTERRPVRGERPAVTSIGLGVFCRPLRGLKEHIRNLNPGLAPGATLCRHLRWLIVRCFPQRKTACALFTSLLFLLPVAFVYPQGNDLDYSKFLHTSQRHASTGCSSCHHRNDNSARPSFPGHKDCIECHRTQFVTASTPMCSICHANVNGTNPPLKAFPDNFKESFNMKFDHAQHMNGSARPKNGCISCHRSPLRRGVALSIPANLSAHDQCYSCHTPNSQVNGRDLASCGVCHDQKPYGRTSNDAPAFHRAFSHAQHSGRQRLGCADCHNYTAGLPQKRQVSSPRAVEHFPNGNNTCATCHNGKRSFGGDLDFKACRRCHMGNSFRLGT